MVDIADHLRWKPTECQTTMPGFELETDADQYIIENPVLKSWFEVIPQVTARPVNRLDRTSKTIYRLDFLLVPRSELVYYHKWEFGAVVIESKKSFEKIGPPLNQCIDYVHAITSPIPSLNNARIIPDFALVFGYKCAGGPLASICHHQRVGGILCPRDGNFNPSDSGTWVMECGQTPLCEFNEDSFNVSSKAKDIGRKAGRR